ncbi:MAG: hypothetical protein HY074_18915 [Deltaproteobacteria bacterium]|nr:hypothetical protein [Deltaproteobacteria bacterium]
MRPIRLVLFILGTVSLANQAGARTFAIHAVGIDPDNLKQNHGDFYSEAEDFTSYCSKASDTDCTLFIDPDKSKTEQVGTTDFAKLKAKTAGKPTFDQVKKALIEALDKAQFGDQVSFTIADHGWVEGGNAPAMDGGGTYGSAAHRSLFERSQHTSCIALAGLNDDICADDIAKIIKEHKKPGVRLFVAGEACFTGAFASLGNNEVCTFTGADRWRMGGGGDAFWSQANGFKRRGQVLSLEDMRRRGHWGIEQARGGGFGTQTTRAQLCANGGLKDPNIDFSQSEVNKEDRYTLAMLANEYNRKEGTLGTRVAKSVCKFDFEQDNVSSLSYLLQAMRTINGVIAPEIGPVRALAQARCTGADQPHELCSAIRSFERDIGKFQSYADRLKQIDDKFEDMRSALSDADDKVKSSSGSSAAEARAQRGELLERYRKAQALYAKELGDAYPLKDDGFLHAYNIIAENLCVKLGYPGEPNAGVRAYSLNGKAPSSDVGTEDLDQAETCEKAFQL